MKKTRLCNIELFKLYEQKRDIKTRNKIVENNLQYVKQIANRYARNSKESFEDLFQVGTLGLIKAVETYDLSKGVKFTPFALPKIKGEILHWLRDKGRLIKIPRHIQELHQKIKKHSNENSISYEKSAQILGIEKNKARELNEIYQQYFDPMVEDIEAVKYSDIVDVRASDIISILPDEHRLVVSCRMLQEMTIKDTAACLGLKLKNVKDLEKQAIELLQKEYCKNGN